MIQGKMIRELKRRLDEIGRQLVRASSMTEEEAGAAAASQWLFARTRARILSEQDRRDTGERWSILLHVLRHAVPATGLAAALAFGLFVYSSSGAPQPAEQFSDQALFETNDAGVQHVVFAERRPLSPDEVLETIINPEREASK